MRFRALVLLLLLSSCTTTKNTGISTEVIAKCTSKLGDQAKFESSNPNYSEIIVKGNVKKYRVGRSYVLILRKN